MQDGQPQGRIDRRDVLCVWNRYGHVEQIADSFERDGGTVLVAENGYVRGRHDGGDYYALAVHGHNGAGQWHVGGPERWDALGITLKPWRDDGAHILIAPNRSFGMRGMVMPKEWAEEQRVLYAACHGCEVRVRAHPGNAAPKVPLAHDLAGARFVVIWSSSVGVRALIEGVPVVCRAPYWICKSATAANLTRSEMTERRLRAMHALAWAQWRVDEIASGEAFDYVLRAARQDQVAASA